MKEIKEKYSIGEISENFQIPKSTLRYWESENLIELERNETNDYREYTLQQMTEISDIAFYRSLNVPVKKLKKLHEMNVNDLKIVLNETQIDIDNQISKLLYIKEGIRSRKDKIQQLAMLEAEPYKKSKPDMDCITLFQMSNYYLQNPNDFVIVISSGKNSDVKYGLANSKITEEDEIIWENKLQQGNFIQCLLKVSFDTPEQNNLSEHLEYLSNQGYKTGITVARYLLTALDTIRYEYYKAWIEIL